MDCLVENEMCFFVGFYGECGMQWWMTLGVLMCAQGCEVQVGSRFVEGRGWRMRGVCSW